MMKKHRYTRVSFVLSNQSYTDTGTCNLIDHSKTKKSKEIHKWNIHNNAISHMY